MTFAAGPVTVEVPATSANLGPGFDCLGVALALHDTLTAEVVPGPLEVTIEGEGVADLPTDDTHLVVRAMADVFAAAGVEPPGLRLHCVNRIPQARGLGSSSAAIVGGLVLARALLADPDLLALLDDVALLRLANRREGHPDNVAPALLGGLVVSGQVDGQVDAAGVDEVWALPAGVADGLAATVFVPPTSLSTETARGLLPGEVPHAVAVANTGRAALLVAALASGDPGALMRGSEDFLHQDFREPAMPDSLALVRRLRSAGVPASVSGAGPTVLAWRGRGLSEVPAAPRGWARIELDLDLDGARVLLG